MSEENKKIEQKSYRWALYILLLLLGHWFGRTTADKDRWFYWGPDAEKANNAYISLLVTGDPNREKGD